MARTRQQQVFEATECVAAQHVTLPGGEQHGLDALADEHREVVGEEVHHALVERSGRSEGRGDALAGELYGELATHAPPLPALVHGSEALDQPGRVAVGVGQGGQGRVLPFELCAQPGHGTLRRHPVRLTGRGPEADPIEHAPRAPADLGGVGAVGLASAGHGGSDPPFPCRETPWLPIGSGGSGSRSPGRVA
jgi:hypothetical protein